MNTHHPAPLCLVRHTRASDIDEHVEQLTDWTMRYDQLDYGRFDGRFTDIRWPGLQLFAESTTRRIRQRGDLPEGTTSVALLWDEQARGEIAVNGIRVGSDALMVCEAAEIDICTPTDCTLVGLVVETELLRDASQGLPMAVDPGELLTLRPPPGLLRRWRMQLVETVQTLATRPELLADERARALMQDELLQGLVQALASAGDEAVIRADQRKRVVDRACELMLSRLEDPPTLAEVCQRVGASPRKLAYCFQDQLGVSPARYAKSVRLNAVRRELARSRQGADCVYDVAARWGFWHFGHFSSDYKRQFEELPSETLRRAREPVAA
ncbi:helix-turn-helix domain-containing protein [Pelomonas sp. KK5]|uniref:helix-turn-helix domain-containing protein n=1 Tax=Pelomonas sp. KK5 TaxID=1855730 RepID=UPI00097BDB01|nr:helix-turn-helix domain-containing protein [Pelomonas sp. KK5]